MHARLHSLPASIDPARTLHGPAISCIASRHIRKLICISGTVVRVGELKMFESKQVCVAASYMWLLHAWGHVVTKYSLCGAGFKRVGGCLAGRMCVGMGVWGDAGTQQRVVCGWCVESPRAPPPPHPTAA